MPRRKEPTYFGSDLPPRPPALDERAYLGLFEGVSDQPAVGEASVWYLYSDSAAEEIRRFAPDARIVIMLREPASFIASLHAHLLFVGQEDLTDLAAALAAEPERAQGNRLPAGVWWPGTLQYRRLARYTGFVARYLDVFGRERVRVVVHEEMLADPGQTLAGVLSYLDVDPSFRPQPATVNTSARRARSRRLQRLITSPRFDTAVGRLGGSAHHLLSRSLVRLNTTVGQSATIDAALLGRLRSELADERPRLESLLDRELSVWARPDEATG